MSAAARAALASLVEAERRFEQDPTLAAIAQCEQARAVLADALADVEALRGVNAPSTVRAFVAGHPRGVQWARERLQHPRRLQRGDERQA